MGQKTHPTGLRTGIIRTWDSKWFARKGQYRENLLEDIQLRKFVRKELTDADVSKIEILRSPSRVTINIYTARPGVVIGQGGQRVEDFKKELETLSSKAVQLNVLEIRRPEVDAALVAKNIAQQIEGRISYRRAMKRAIQSAMRLGAEGIKVKCGGRLNGAEIARSEEYKEGRIPLHTLRADIDFARDTAHTTAGCVGVKVWIFHGEVLGGMKAYWDKSFAEEKRQKQKSSGNRGRGGAPKGGKRPPRKRTPQS
ncbi:MAG TPA: 30S ribosomal protein S3 [candidate division Zixibacteria bacterium]|nr:30S ribosomal protein S3 [candidate division Zixibacteria bacterium]